MNKTNFNILKPIILDATERPNKGKLLFSVEDFTISYICQINPLNKVLSITIQIRSKDDPNWSYDLKRYDISNEGVKTGEYENQSVLTKYDNDLEAQRQLVIRLAEEASLEAIENISNVKQIEYQSELEKLNNWPQRPDPIEIVKYRYDEVIQYFTNIMTLTDEGIIWSKELPFLDGKMSEYIDYQS